MFPLERTELFEELTRPLEAIDQFLFSYGRRILLEWGGGCSPPSLSAIGQGDCSYANDG